MKYVVLVSLFSVSCLSAFADGKKSTATIAEENVNRLKKPLALYETFDNRGVNLGVRADVLYMVYDASLLTLMTHSTIDSVKVLHGKPVNISGEMNVGCNLAVMYTMCQSPGYSFESSWYHIVSQFSKNVVANDIAPAHVVALNTPYGVPGSAATAGHLTINLFDFLMKKDFAFGDWVSFTPAMGLVGGYLNSVNAAHFLATSGSFSVPSDILRTTAVTVADLSYQSNFKGIGLKIGGSSSFDLWKGFKLDGAFFYNVMYGLKSLELSYAQNGVYEGLLAGASAAYSQHQGLSFFDTLLGLSWSSSFSADSLFLDLHAGWRFQYFPEGWGLYEAELTNALGQLPLYGQGLQAGLTFRF